MNATVTVTQGFTPQDLAALRHLQTNGDGLYLVEVNGGHVVSVAKSPKKVGITEIVDELTKDAAIVQPDTANATQPCAFFSATAGSNEAYQAEGASGADDVRAERRGRRRS